MEIGDTVIREFYGHYMPLEITDITPDKIICGEREFLKETGGEIDLELGCDGKRMAVSRIFTNMQDLVSHTPPEKLTEAVQEIIKILS